MFIKAWLTSSKRMAGWGLTAMEGVAGGVTRFSVLASGVMGALGLVM